MIRRSFGRQFHSAGPEKENARSANFVRSHESWQNDICSFRAMTVALTVSFKLISF